MPKSLGKQIRDSEIERLTKDYITMDVAIQATGYSDKKLLSWADQHGIDHYKYNNRWYFRKSDFLRAIQQP